MPSLSAAVPESRRLKAFASWAAPVAVRAIPLSSCPLPTASWARPLVSLLVACEISREAVALVSKEAGR